MFERSSPLARGKVAVTRVASRKTRRRQRKRTWPSAKKKRTKRGCSVSHGAQCSWLCLVAAEQSVRRMGEKKKRNENYQESISRSTCSERARVHTEHFAKINLRRAKRSASVNIDQVASRRRGAAACTRDEAEILRRVPRLFCVLPSLIFSCAGRVSYSYFYFLVFRFLLFALAVASFRQRQQRRRPYIVRVPASAINSFSIFHNARERLAPLNNSLSVCVCVCASSANSPLCR